MGEALPLNELAYVLSPVSAVELSDRFGEFQWPIITKAAFMKYINDSRFSFWKLI